MASTRVQVCGRVVAELNGRRIDTDLPGRQGRLLFVYLVSNRFRAATRDELVDALWPNEAPANADGALSALLSKLRRVATLEGRGEVRLVLPADAWVDLEAATEALHRAESAISRRAATDAWAPARVAQHIAVRGFLPGEDAPWIIETRRRLDAIHLRALEIVAQACLDIGGGELDTAERAARTLVEKAPFRESGYRSLMEVLASRDNRAEALRVYENLREVLREELGTSPSHATQELHKKLLGG